MQKIMEQNMQSGRLPKIRTEKYFKSLISSEFLPDGTLVTTSKPGFKYLRAELDTMNYFLPLINKTCWLNSNFIISKKHANWICISLYLKM